MNKVIHLSLLVLLLASTGLKANWYETTGQALIEQGNIQAARQAAIDDALHRAALFAGARLDSRQQLVKGIMTQQQLSLSSDAEFQQIQLVSETHSNNQVTVVLRAQILAQHHACQSRQFRQPLLLSQVALHSRQDAVHGQLFNIGDDVTTQLSHKLRDYSPAVLATPAKEVFSMTQLTAAVSDSLFVQGYSYTLLATIRDMSLGPLTNRFWQSNNQQRFFAIDVILYDLLQHKIRHQQEYRTSANWAESNHSPASHSQAFWQLPYGQKIDNVLQAVADDIQQLTQCKPLTTRISAIRQQQVMLNMGMAHGLKTGDTLQVIQVQRHPTQPEVKRLIHNPLQLTITELTEHHAWASSTEQHLLSHLQIGDLLSVSSR
ncbi:flagellar assembly protein T N-terminal domain-containing protein [Arsukibacterium sp.]|uniref:flagellar assembly protein T N-terminal domain-containing protein n=1 Tax=Arsukibacterium sp. TaxID=1977258 RepID=UPI002FDAB0BD